MNSLPHVQFFPSLKSIHLPPGDGNHSEALESLFLPTMLFAQSGSVECRTPPYLIRRCMESLRHHIAPNTVVNLDLGTTYLTSEARASLTNLVRAQRESLETIKLPSIPDRATWRWFHDCTRLREIVLGQEFDNSREPYYWGSRPDDASSPLVSTVPELNKLVLRGSALKDHLIVLVMRQFGFPNLRIATFKFPSRPTPSVGESYALPAVLLRCLSATAPLLRHVHFDASAVEDDVGVTEPISMHFFATTLAHCVELEHLHLDLGPLAGLRLDETAGAGIAAAWPQLKHLHLSSRWVPKGGEPANVTNLRLVDLAQFAARCPRIEYINLPFKEEDDGIVIDTATPLAQVRALLPLQPVLPTLNLAAPLPRITNPTKLVDFFRIIFPDLRKIMLPRRAQVNNDEVMLRWEQVQDQLDHRWRQYELHTAPAASAVEKAAFDYDDDAGYLPGLDIGEDDDESEIGSPDLSEDGTD